MNQTIRKIETILTSQYDVSNYTDFIREIFPAVQIVAPDRFHKEYTNFSSHIEGTTLLFFTTSLDIRAGISPSSQRCIRMSSLAS